MGKKILKTILVIFAVVAIGAFYLDNTPTSGYVDLSPQESYQFIQQKQNDPEFIILDVRTPEEISQGALHNAVFMNFLEPGFAGKLASLDKTKTYLVYCQSGNRSSKTLAAMENLKFEKVFHLKGGVRDWQSDQLPLVF